MVRTENRFYSKVGFFEDGTWLLQPNDRPMNAPVVGHLDRHVTNRGLWGTGATSADQLCVTIGNLRKRAERWLVTRNVLDLVADVNRPCQ